MNRFPTKAALKNEITCLRAEVEQLREQLRKAELAGWTCDECSEVYDFSPGWAGNMCPACQGAAQAIPDIQETQG